MRCGKDDIVMMKKLTVILLALCVAVFVEAQSDIWRSDSLQEVVVTGTGTRHLLKDAPVQTEVITQKMLRNYGGKSLEDILAGLTASFAFAEGDMGSQMQLNGLGNSYILILIDGKRIHGDVGGENDLGLIDPHNIEKIEIVKGAQSALYGSDAMAGVVNIITKKSLTPDLSPKGEGRLMGIYADNSTRYGSHNDLRQHNSLVFTFGNFSSQTNFQLQRNDGWQNTAEEYAEATVLTDSKNKTVNKFRNWQIAERMTYKPKESLELYAEGTYYKKNIMRPQNGTHPSCDVYTYDLRYNNASASVGGKWYPGSKKDVITLDINWNKHAYYYDYTKGTYEYVLLKGEEYGDMDGEWYSVLMKPGQSKLQSDQQRVMGQLKGIFYLPYDNTLNAGAEYRYDYLKAPDRTETGTASDQTAALYVQDEYNPLKWFNLTAGFRLVDNRSFGFRLTPKVSAMLSVDDFRFRMGWSQGFKTPTVKELHYRYLHVMGSSTFFNIGNTNLDPQTSNYYSVNAEYRGRKVTASVTGYLNKLDNMIALVNVFPGEIPAGITTAYLGDGSNNVQARMYKNMDDARTCGVDVTMSYKPMNDLTLNAAYSYLDTKAHLYDEHMDRMNTVVIDGTAHHKWNVSAMFSHTFSPSYSLGISLSGRGSSKRYYQNNGDGKAFQIWRINTTHDLGKTNKMLAYRLEFGIDNIFNYVDRTMHPYHLGNNTSGTTVYGTFSIKFKYGKRVKQHNLSTKQKNNDEED
jgi:outer membrane receptor for ferrienterochelin and colicins